MSVSCECCVLSIRGLCDGLITRPEEFYWLGGGDWGDLENPRKGRPWPTGGGGAVAPKKNVNCVHFWLELQKLNYNPRNRI